MAKPETTKQDMVNPDLAKGRTGILHRFLRDTGGAFIVEFAITFPVLVVLSFGLMEFALLAFDYQRAAEASRRAVRFAIINPSIPNTANLLDIADPSNPPTIVCISTAGTVSCIGGSPSDDTKTNGVIEADVRFQALLAQMQSAYPPIQEENLRISYTSSDVGTATTAGGILPLVTIEILNLEYKFLMGSLVGIESIILPDFKTTVLGSGRVVNAT